LTVDLNHHHHRKEGCSGQGLVQNVQDSFFKVHHEEVESEFEAVLLWLAKLGNKLE
jgi:hypothetical protein